MAEQKTRVVKGPGRRGPMGPRPKIKNPGKLFTRLMGYVMSKYAIQYILVFVCIFVATFATVQGTAFMEVLIDDYIAPMIGSSNPDYSALLNAMKTVALFYLCGVVATFARERLMMYIAQGSLKSLRDDLFERMEKLPIKYFDTHAHGDIMSIYTNDVDTLRQMIAQSIPQIVSSTVTIITVFISMVRLSVPLTCVSILMVCVTLFVTKNIASKSGTNFLAQQKSLGALNGFIEERMEGQKVVKVFTHEEESIQEFNELNDALFTASNNANKFANIIGPINAQIGNVSYVICAVFGGFLALNGIGGFSVGKLASYLTFNKSFSMPINQLSQQFNSIIMALAGAERVFSLMDEKPEVDEGYVTLVNVEEINGELVETDKKDTNLWAWKYPHKSSGITELVKLEGDVTFHDVDFGYTEEKMVLHNIKMFATPGQKIAFVGSTGAGKTTITNLINRFYAIQDGKI
ncbi:MAG: ABC transporter ATP-binding protein, partial [Erysipelotrichaceae bacterium]|nr:ABC transporter ATP-binding protein [Erysipelotrichaceae bacterium]